ncbi:MAG: lipopolysaccharide kinase InaA family protein [Desulfobacterales bacterium]
MIHTRKVDSYRFGFSLDLTEAQLHTLAGFFHQPDPGGVSVLGGRTSVCPLQLDGVGSVVIKHYRRGGLLRYFIKRRYLRIGKTRAQHEFELLNIVGTIGINIPQPIAYAHGGGLFYKAWMVTRAIKEPVSLVSLSLQDEEEARRAVSSTAEQIALLVQNNILHVDLHPGNVLVDRRRQVYLVDFDKAHVYRGSPNKLKQRYIGRWQRAVGKHRLPEMLSEALRVGLQDIRM